MFIIALIVLVLTVSAFGVIAGTVSYLRDPKAMQRRQQHRDHLAFISSI